MIQSSGAHGPLRQEWTETPPEVSYRFVVSPRTLRAADSVARAFLRRRRRWWQPPLASIVWDAVRVVVGLVVIAFIALTSVLFALVVHHKLFVLQHSGSGLVLQVVTVLATSFTFLISFLVLWTGFRIAARRLATSSLERAYDEFYSGNEFLLEARKSHLWLEEPSSGAIRRWSTVEQIVEFEEGMWLLLRRRTNVADRGILISKESLPGSCVWSELKEYLGQRVESAKHEADVQSASGVQRVPAKV
jgi:hypothetical protein